MRQLINGEAQYKQRCKALRELTDSAEADRGRARDLLRVVDALLNSDVFLNSDEQVFSARKFEQMLKTIKDLPPRVEAGLKLCATMARLTRLCEPKGRVIGPSCAVTLIEFEKLDFAGVLGLRGPAGHLAMGLAISSAENVKKAGLGLLSKEDRALYEEAKPFCRGHAKQRPTLMSLASSILKDERGFSRRNADRILAEAQEFPFKEGEDTRSDYLRRSMFYTVDSFGSDKTTMLHRLAEMRKSVETAAVLQLHEGLAALVAQNQIALNAVASAARAECVQAIGPALGHLMLSARGELAVAVGHMLKGFGSFAQIADGQTTDRPPLKLVSSS
jgi:hypothetical protein